MGTESMVSNLLEKLKGFGEESMILMNSAQTKLKAVGADEMVNNLQGKMKQVYFLLENFASFSIGWLGEVVLPGLRNGSMIGSMQEKLKGIGEESMILMNSTQTKLKAVGADEMVNNLQGKIKQVYFLLENFASFSIGWLGEVVLPGSRNGSMIGSLQEKLNGIGEESMIMMNSTLAKLKAMGADEMLNNPREKLKQPLLMLENFGLFLVGWFDEIFPPETRKQLLHWLLVAAPYVVAGLVLLVLLWCFIPCIGLCIVYIFRCIGLCIVCLFRCIGSCIVYFFHSMGITMMKAPGMGFWIPRFIFEACPRICFRVFRALSAIAGKVIR